jgi:hypothetical protein
MTGNFKIVVFVPSEAADAVRQAAGQAGAGKIGNYTYCSFSSAGVGRFLPGEGSRPAIGTVGKLEEVPEERIEFLCAKELLDPVTEAIKSSHPYEEVALDIYPLYSAHE